MIGSLRRSQSSRPFDARRRIEARLCVAFALNAPLHSALDRREDLPHRRWQLRFLNVSLHRDAGLALFAQSDLDAQAAPPTAGRRHAHAAPLYMVRQTVEAAGTLADRRTLRFAQLDPACDDLQRHPHS
ncbi:MAG TPA: hypothetical protein VM491_18065 [Burkholderiaceae bacterium]|nr:hypothetical protein [Burkholderiaceae bacterium]